MPLSWDEQGERTQGERDRERAARELARRTKVSRRINRRPRWAHWLALTIASGALVVLVDAPFGQASAFAGSLMILVAAAFVA